jgi:hypothetical protein
LCGYLGNAVPFDRPDSVSPLSVRKKKEREKTTMVRLLQDFALYEMNDDVDEEEREGGGGI